MCILASDEFLEMLDIYVDIRMWFKNENKSKNEKASCIIDGHDVQVSSPSPYGWFTLYGKTTKSELSGFFALLKVKTHDVVLYWT